MVFGLMKSDKDSSKAAQTNHKAAPKQVQEQAPKRSAKIEERLDEVVQNCSPLDKRRSPDLVPLQAEYDKMKHELRALVNVSKTYRSSMQKTQDAKFELIKQMSGMSKRSPMYDDIGADVDEKTSKDLATMRQHNIQPPTTTDNVKELKEDSADVKSMLALYKFGDAQATANDNEYFSLIVDYVVDWERIVTKRVEAELKKVKELEGDLRHYDHKVDKLRDRANSHEEKGKELGKSEVEKLDRNEDKLKEAFNAYEREAAKTCALMEAVTHDGYKDLYPLVKNFLKWEMNRINREHDMAQGMNDILASLKDKNLMQTMKLSAPKEEPVSEGSSSEHSDGTHDKEDSGSKNNE